MDIEHGIARRAVLMSAGAGIGAGLAGGLSQAATPAAAAGGEIWSKEYWAQKGAVKLSLWRKRIGAPKAGEMPRPVLFLVHGSSNSARTSFDLPVPGSSIDYSAMNLFAREGYDVWTMDHDGYGFSGSSGNSSDIASGVEDLKAAIPVVLKETGRSKVHMYGPSSGAIRAGAYAQAEPDRVDRLVLAAFTYKGKDSVEMDRRRKRIEQLRSSNRRKRDATMVRSIFTRDGHAEGYEPALIEAIIAAETKHGDSVPSGTYIDMAVNLPLVDPTKVKSPVLMLRGERDGNSTNEDLLDFYRQLPNGDRQFVILPNTAHSLGWSKNRHLLWYAVKNFIGAPAAV
ncbi:MAG: alpha/beta hydrolase [Alphaproteobacteria bacterium]|nr:alpha/beta hydrolase [Alphaproteobacteria bacterium]